MFLGSSTHLTHLSDCASSSCAFRSRWWFSGLNRSQCTDTCVAWRFWASWALALNPRQHPNPTHSNHDGAPYRCSRQEQHQAPDQTIPHSLRAPSVCVFGPFCRRNHDRIAENWRGLSMASFVVMQAEVNGMFLPVCSAAPVDPREYPSAMGCDTESYREESSSGMQHALAAGRCGSTSFT